MCIIQRTCSLLHIGADRSHEQAYALIFIIICICHLSYHGFPSPWKTSTYLFLTPFLADDPGRFDGGLESKSSILLPGGLGGPEGGRAGPPLPPGGGGVMPGVTLSARDDFWRLIPPSGISVNPIPPALGGIPLLDP